MTGVWLVAGVAIFTSGVVLLTDIRGLGRQFIALQSRSVTTRWHREHLERNRNAYRFAFGLAAVVIGVVWVWITLESLVG
jgi:hypothetical protein